MTSTFETDSDGFVILSEPVTLPDALDLLIVGGGPAGLAAGFRAKELGLAALIIDYDDILKRIRDYPKDKLILPDFGGGDKLRFPLGEDLIAKLQFEAIDKDDLCKHWKKLLVECSVPAQIGIELTGLTKGSDFWEAQCYNFNTKSDYTLRAKHVALAMGCGEPRRFDIPGNAEGIMYRLVSAESYVGKPSCVLGGGTSAAEAVIAISNAKAQASDKTDVYWSCRGDSMPKVSRALAEVLFDAQMGNGNIKIFKRSEAFAVVTAQDHKEYLAIRTDRRFIDGRPNETSYLEFEKEQCIACIGEDLPLRLLGEMGINMVVGGPKAKKRMQLTPLMETQLPNVYMLGDLLSQAYLETNDFDSPPEDFAEVKHRGNIKIALRDAVKVVNIIKQKLAGETDISTAVSDAATSIDPEKTIEAATIRNLTVAPEVDSPPSQSIPEERVVEESAGYLVRVLPGDVLEDEYPLNANGITTIGRSGCAINFPNDTMLSDTHASISHNQDGYFIRDDGGATGVYLRAIAGQNMVIQPGQMVRVGRQFLVFQVEKGVHSVLQLDANGKKVNQFEIGEKTVVAGREAPDITLDSDDRTLSRRHVALAARDGQMFLKDLKSVNGSYLIVRDAHKIEDDQQFKVGSQSFQLMLKDSAPSTNTRATTPKESPAQLANHAGETQPVPVATPVDEPVERPITETSPERPKLDPAPIASAGANEVVFSRAGKSVPLAPGKTICELAEENGIHIVAECHAGICGSDPVRIIAGKENLNEISDAERDAIEDICDLDPEECRLACMLRAKGPVTVEILPPQ